MDIWLNPTEENADKILKAVNEFGFSSYSLKIEDFTKAGNVIQLGFPPIRIDLLTEVDGVTFKECIKNTEQFEYDDIILNVIGYDDLIKNKKTTGRYRDLDDLENLKRE